MQYTLTDHCRYTYRQQGVALTGRNTTGPPCSVGRPDRRQRSHAPGWPAGSVTDEQINTGPLGGPVIMIVHVNKECRKYCINEISQYWKTDHGRWKHPKSGAPYKNCWWGSNTGRRCWWGGSPHILFCHSLGLTLLDYPVGGTLGDDHSPW